MNAAIEMVLEMSQLRQKKWRKEENEGCLQGCNKKTLDLTK